jgi:murein L,D-transpeptidase YcbB/YkuD
VRASLPIASLCAWLVVGCAHTRAAIDTPPAEAAPEASRDAEPAKKPAETKQRPPRAFAAGSGLRLSTSPEGQLTPDGLKLVRARLRAEGDLAPSEADERADEDALHLDDPTEQAVRSAQRRHGLPATGIPDEATIRALGLDPTRVLRRKE